MLMPFWLSVVGSIPLVKALVAQGLPNVDESKSSHNCLFYGGAGIAWWAPRATTPLSRLMELAIPVEEMNQSREREDVPEVQGLKSGRFINGRWTTPEIQAIRAGDADLLKKLILHRLEALDEALAKQSITVCNGGTEGAPLLSEQCFVKGSLPWPPLSRRNCIAAVDAIPMEFFLGLPGNNKPFACILHNDSIPSAAIAMTKKDGCMISRYHCFACMPGVTRDGKHHSWSLLSVIQAIRNSGLDDAMEFMERLLGVAVSEWETNILQMLKEYKDYIAEVMPINFPVLYRELNRAKALPIWDHLLNLTETFLPDREETGNNVHFFFASFRQMEMSLFESGYRKGISPASLYRKCTFLVRLGLLNKLPDDQIPKDLLDQSRSFQNIHGIRYRVGYYQIPSFSIDLFSRAEQLLQTEILDVGIRRRSYSRETELMAHGKQSADRVYVQDMRREVSMKTKCFYDAYLTRASNLLTEQGWLTESLILAGFPQYSNWKLRDLSGKCLPRLMQELDLQHQYLNMDIALEYNITGIHYGSKVLIPLR
jgi:hypothetical protein